MTQAPDRYQLSGERPRSAGHVADRIRRNHLPVVSNTSVLIQILPHHLQYVNIVWNYFVNLSNIGIYAKSFPILV